MPDEMAQAGRAEASRRGESAKFYDNVPRQTAIDRGTRPTPVRWVDVNKRDESKYSVRCRLVGKELKVKTTEALLAHDLFNAVPPWRISDSEEQL